MDRGAGARTGPSFTMRYILLIAVAALGFNLVAQQPPPDPDSIFRQAVLLHRSGDMDGAIRKYREYLKLKPDSIEGRSNLGAALARTGRYDEAIAEYEAALKAAPKNAPILLNLALAYYKSGRIGEATPKLERAAAGQHSERADHTVAGELLRPARRI